jgi:nitrite reductase (NADH) large subunit
MFIAGIAHTCRCGVIAGFREVFQVKYVIVGNGVAANSAAEAIRKTDSAGSITMLSRSRHCFYYVPALPEYLAGEKAVKDFTLHDLQWYEKNAIDLHRETEVRGVDPAAKTVVTGDGSSYPYDRLLLATGGRSNIPPLKGAEEEGVMTLRTIDDADRILASLSSARRLLVIGGGLLGLEAGNGLRKRGLQVSVIEAADRLLPRQTDPAASALLKAKLEDMGFSFHLGVRIREIVRRESGLSVSIEGGEDLHSDMVLLVSAGVRPETALAKALGLEIGLGVKVDDRMATAQEDIYAAGDLIEHRGRYYGIWPAATAQGRVAGVNMAGGDMRYEGTVPSNKLKVAGVDLVAMGELDASGEEDSLVRVNDVLLVYRKLVLRDNVIIGAVLLGDTRGADYIQYAIQAGRDISDVKNEIIEEGFDFKRLKKVD